MKRQNEQLMRKRGSRSRAQRKAGEALQMTGWSRLVKTANNRPPFPAALVSNGAEETTARFRSELDQLTLCEVLQFSHPHE
jgi:hypothetical protein